MKNLLRLLSFLIFRVYELVLDLFLKKYISAKLQQLIQAGVKTTAKGVLPAEEVNKILNLSMDNTGATLINLERAKNNFEKIKRAVRSFQYSTLDPLVKKQLMDGLDDILTALKEGRLEEHPFYEEVKFHRDFFDAIFEAKAIEKKPFPCTWDNESQIPPWITQQKPGMLNSVKVIKTDIPIPDEVKKVFAEWFDLVAASDDDNQAEHLPLTEEDRKWTESWEKYQQYLRDNNLGSDDSNPRAK